MLRLGIVGTGAMADYHAQRFAKIPGLRIAAVCDKSLAKAAAFAEGRGIRASFREVSAMAASGLVDAVSIASIDGAHEQAALAALDRGLPVFCEKPLARGLKAAEAMAAAARRAGAPALVNFSKRNGGLLSLARRLAAEGRIGALRGAEFFYLQSWLIQDAWGDWRTTPRWRWRLDEEQSTWGVIGDLGSHLFDAALYVLGGAKVRSCAARRFEPAAADLASLAGRPAFESFEARLEAEGQGALEAGAKAGWSVPGRLDAFGLAITGDSGSMRLDFDRSRSRLFLREGEDGPELGLEAPSVPSTYERFAALASGSEDPLPGEDIDFERGLAVQRLIDGCGRLCAAART